MGPRLVTVLVVLACSAGVAGAETLGDVLKARGLTPPAGALPGLDQTVQSHQILDDQDEFTEVVHVYAGLRRPEATKYRELLRGEFEARFGPIPLAKALEPDILRQIFGGGLE